MLLVMRKLPVLMTIVAILPDMAQACTLVNVQVDPTSTSFTITWQTEECNNNIERAEVQWEHVKFLACTDGHEDPSSRGVLDNLTHTKAVVRNLHPYSKYQVMIKATAKDRTIIQSVTVPVETGMAKPETQVRPNNISRSQKTTIFFYWVDPGECEKQHGQRDRYEVMLEGIDSWDLGKKEIEAGTLPVDSSYLAHQLKPFSNYQLTVFNRNFDSKTNQAYVNREDPLIIKGQTKPTKPSAPESVESTSQTSNSVFLTWRLAQPPTGNLDKFQLEVGRTEEDGTSVSWRPVEVEGHHVCNFNTEAIELFCYSVTDLDPGESYRFRIRVWNLDVDEPSPWSSELTQATAMAASVISSSTLGPNPSSEITPTPSPSSSPLVIAIVSIIAVIVFVAIVIVCLVYKLKITRLKQQMRNEEEWNQLGHLSHSSSYLPGPSQASFSTSTRLADSYLTSLETSADFGSLRSANIQTRRLPEPPTEPEYSEAYEVMPIPGVFAPIDGGAVSPLESTRIQEEEITDVEGYLRPTFADRSSPIHSRSPSIKTAEPSSIPASSYGELGAKSGRSSTSPSQPLISPPVHV